MTNRELDVAMAELMGWEGYHDINYVDGDTWYSSCRNCGDTASENEEILAWNWGDPPIPGCEGYPPYSTSIAAAMLVVEKMSCTTKEFWRFQYFSTGAIAEFDYEGGRDLPWKIGVHVGEAATLPEAICRAALAVDE